MKIVHEVDHHFHAVARSAVAFLSVFAAFAEASKARGSEVGEFYKGKTVDLIIASEAGGGYDLYARLVAPFLERHLPGNPRFVPSTTRETGASQSFCSRRRSAGDPLSRRRAFLRSGSRRFRQHSPPVFRIGIS
jgi:hypothetical protein